MIEIDPSGHLGRRAIDRSCAHFDGLRDSAARGVTGMVGVKMPILMPIAYHALGGWKRSGFGDPNRHGPVSIRSCTRTRTVTSRWP